MEEGVQKKESCVPFYAYWIILFIYFLLGIDLKNSHWGELFKLRAT